MFPNPRLIPQMISLVLWQRPASESSRGADNVPESPDGPAIACVVAATGKTANVVIRIAAEWREHVLERPISVIMFSFQIPAVTTVLLLSAVSALAASLGSGSVFIASEEQIPQGRARVCSI